MRRASNTLALVAFAIATACSHAPAKHGALFPSPSAQSSYAFATPERSFAPYVDMTLHPTPDLAQLARSAGIKMFTLAFVITGGKPCTAAWGGSLPVGSDDFAARINALRAAGGDVAISFGGADGTELATSCATTDALVALYQSVLDRYQVRFADFDIEGSDARNNASIDRRSNAIAILQSNEQAAGHSVFVSITLLANRSGLTARSVSIVRSAVAHGVRLGVVNLMTMDFGRADAPSPGGQMGSYAIESAGHAHDQLAAIIPQAGDAALWSLLGITVMIGQNDVTAEILTPADAQQVVSFARAQAIGRLSMWSVMRDRPCPDGIRHSAIGTCSGIAQPAWMYSHILSAFSS